jgi:hypothetical protein
MNSNTQQTLNGALKSLAGTHSGAPSARQPRKLFPAILSALYLTVVLGGATTSFAQELDKLPASLAPHSASCSAAESESGQCQHQDEKGRPLANAKNIFTNFGKGGNLFDSTAGLPISGPSSSSGTQAVGFPFTPKADATMQGLELPLWWGGGSNSVDICLYADVDGLPGVIIECVTAYNLYPFGGFIYPNCFWPLIHPIDPWPCFCWNVIGWDPYPLLRGTRYWIVVYPDFYEPDFYGGWYLTASHTVGEYATFDGTAWTGQKGDVPAVAVAGTN